MILLKYSYKEVLNKARMSIFFKTRKIMVFEILNFDFYQEKKKATVSYCLYGYKHMKGLV